MRVKKKKKKKNDKYDLILRDVEPSSNRILDIDRGMKNFTYPRLKISPLLRENLLGWKVIGWRRQRLRIWRRKCTESILLCFVLTDLCVASISDNLRTTVIAQPRTRLAVNRMIAQNFKSLLIREKVELTSVFLFLISVSETSRPNWLWNLI